MSIKLFKKLINDLSAFPDKIKLLRICGNGEPLMNKNIVKMLQYAREQKVAEKIELVTNGLLLTPSLIKNLPRFLDRIIISIEGLCAEDYQRICNANINFQSLLDNLASLYTWKGKCNIHIKIHNAAISSPEEKTIFFNIFSNRCDEIYIENLVPMWPQFIIPYFSNEFRWGGRLLKNEFVLKFLRVYKFKQMVKLCLVVLIGIG